MIDEDDQVHSGAIEAASSSLRFLMCVEPNDAEWSWQLIEQAGQFPENQWLAIARQGRMTYLMAGESGRYASKPPEGIDVSTLPVVDQTGVTPTNLRDNLKHIIAMIGKRDPVLAENFSRAVDAINSFCCSGWDRREVMRLMTSIAGMNFSEGESVPVGQFEQEAIRQYVGFAWPGKLSAIYLLFAQIDANFRPGELWKKVLLIPGRLNVLDGLIVFAYDIMAKTLGMAGGEAAIAAASANLKTQCEDFLQAAEDAQDHQTYRKWLFASSPAAMASNFGFDFLSRSAGNSQKSYRVEANVTDERFATSFAAIANDFQNAMDGSALRRQKAKVAELRLSKGEKAAEQLVNQYLKNCLFYPAIAREFLLGKAPPK